MFAKLTAQLRTFSVQIANAGSGVIWSSDGLVVTNAHVVREREPSVILSDGRKFKGTLIARDGRRDLAAFRIDLSTQPGTKLRAPSIVDSDSLQVGQLVLAIGNPLGMTGAVTSGIIHAIGPMRMRGQNWIQADISLAPGNSGGMLTDAEGSIIGITTMIFGGLALAVPVNSVAAFLSAHFSGCFREKTA